MRRGAEVELALVTAAAAPDASAFSAAELASVGLTSIELASVGRGEVIVFRVVFWNLVPRIGGLMTALIRVRRAGCNVLSGVLTINVFGELQRLPHTSFTA